ncbi:hypothetical protein L2E82_33877 [Cichorium intybus]|uniref:Uncharacterized protein n=1 Tax=Cichorium intybus TaxID=13427 RepID=A0ACB9BLC6_CICIN|nr:hypothetical protein L2E82_33877 [Cichorium intybus]
MEHFITKHHHKFKRIKNQLTVDFVSCAYWAEFVSSLYATKCCGRYQVNPPSHTHTHTVTVNTPSLSILKFISPIHLSGFSERLAFSSYNLLLASDQSSY